MKMEGFTDRGRYEIICQDGGFFNISWPSCTFGEDKNVFSLPDTTCINR